MRLFKDFITKDEFVTDANPMKIVDDIVYEFEGKMISVKQGIDDSLIGGNKAEPGGEGGGDDDAGGVEDGEEKVINIVHSHQLVKTSLSEAEFKAWIKKYMKAILDNLQKTNPSRVEIFKTKAAKYVKDVLIANIKDWEFYMGSSCDPEAGMLLLNYREDGVTPYFVVFKDAVIEEKL